MSVSASLTPSFPLPHSRKEIKWVQTGERCDVTKAFRNRQPTCTTVLEPLKKIGLFLRKIAALLKIRVPDP